jgi:hypothetical protein
VKGAVPLAATLNVTTLPAGAVRGCGGEVIVGEEASGDGESGGGEFPSLPLPSDPQPANAKAKTIPSRIKTRRLIMRFSLTVYRYCSCGYQIARNRFAHSNSARERKSKRRMSITMFLLRQLAHEPAPSERM